MACYKVSQDFVTMPPFGAFRDAESYYATLGHEVTTGPATSRALIAISVASALAMRVTPWKSWSPNWA